ncbi:MAG: putative Mannosyl-oligosaccharide 1,2-alpha-mannosidase [Streblomastix strix]|uniref:alpha-1,2-Mannosidase n=1 Tax=Streblomastix strix TaxID=222440 RepID=A0A5J4X445_9EUKA|nr:MAG: putative Mannosyl-oligosaccharide 1,2-alpha-mannosidase [Streblomastix strix]
MLIFPLLIAAQTIISGGKKTTTVDFSETRILYSVADITESPPIRRWPQLQNETLCEERRSAIRDAFQCAWESYTRDAWGNDEVKPLTRTNSNWLGGFGTTIIDSISTMKIMGLDSQYEKAKEWVSQMEMYRNTITSLFETGIRILAGLISAYDMTGELMFLKKAEQIGDILITNYETNKETGIPINKVYVGKPQKKETYKIRKVQILEEIEDKNSYLSDPKPIFFNPNNTDLLPTQQSSQTNSQQSQHLNQFQEQQKILSKQFGKELMNLLLMNKQDKDKDKNKVNLEENKEIVSEEENAYIAEFGLWVEFVALSDRTGDPHYAFHALRSLQSVLLIPQKKRGEILRRVSLNASSYTEQCFSVGAMADSFFEYLIKEEIYLGESYQLNLYNGPINTTEDKKDNQTNSNENDKLNKQENKDNKPEKKEKVQIKDNDDGFNYKQHNQQDIKVKEVKELNFSNNNIIEQQNNTDQDDSEDYIVYVDEYKRLSLHWIDTMLAFDSKMRVRLTPDYLTDKVEDQKETVNEERINSENIDINSKEKDEYLPPLDLRWISGTDCTSNKFTHLSCFVPGNLALGSYYLNNYTLPDKQLINKVKKMNSHLDQLKLGWERIIEEERRKDEKEKQQEKQQEKDKEQEKQKLNEMIIARLHQLAVDLGETCYSMYSNSPSGLPGEWIDMEALDKQSEQKDNKQELNKDDNKDKKKDKINKQREGKGEIEVVEEGKEKKKWKQNETKLNQTSSNNTSQNQSIQINSNIQQQQQQQEQLKTEPKHHPNITVINTQEDLINTINKNNSNNLISTNLTLTEWRQLPSIKGDDRFMLRPEVVESLFYLYRTTGDIKYQERAWKIFQSIEKHCKLVPSYPKTYDGACQMNNYQQSSTQIQSASQRYQSQQQQPSHLKGYAELSESNSLKPSLYDSQPSFFLAETLKYLYLIFSDPATVIPLDQWVFTTEAHPIVRRKYLRKRI